MKQENIVKISDNKRYFIRGGKPFFWLGDTAWLMFQKLNEKEISRFLKNRKSLGYNVIQAILFHEAGDFVDRNVRMTNIMEEKEYWNKVDKTLEIAKKLDLIIVLLPAWGSIVNNEILTIKNIGEYAEFLGTRYKEYDNIIWMLGGDIRGEEYRELYQIEADILKKHNPERLITFHPFGRTSSSMWFHKEKWLDFNTFQSGHRRYDQIQLGEWDDAIKNEEFFGEDNWRYVIRDLSYDVEKPTLDSEPSYESIPKGLHNPRNGYWEEWDVRRYAYWSVFAGAAGHTYGHNSIIQFYSDMSVPGAYGVREVWSDAMHHPGAAQLVYLKELFESVDYFNGKAADELLLTGQRERYHRVSVFAGNDYIFCYDYMGDEFMLNLKEYKNKKLEAYWMNPQSGTYSYDCTLEGIEKYHVIPPLRKGKSNDWVYVLKTVK